MTKTTSSTEADAHVARALEHIEAAQRELERACQELSPIIGGAPQWKRISALYDRVRMGWYWLHGWAQKHRGRLDLDVLGRAAIAQADGPRPFLLHLHWCPEHGPVMRTDEDGCCPSCGRDCHPDAPPEKRE
jgi:hypothetical protein